MSTRTKIALLRRGVSLFYEPDLEEGAEPQEGREALSFTADPALALRDAQVVFICVGTPARADGEANLLAMEKVASQISRHGSDGAVVVEKSTVPHRHLRPGSADAAPRG